MFKDFFRILFRQPLMTIYKFFVRPHLDYGEITYDQPNNEAFCQKFDTGQYNAALVITGAIRGTLKTDLYNKISPKSLSS